MKLARISLRRFAELGEAFFADATASAPSFAEAFFARAETIGGGRRAARAARTLCWTPIGLETPDF